MNREQKVKKTRKNTKCSWCGESINAGDPSVTHQGVSDGDFYYQRYHPECGDAIFLWFKQNKHCYELPEEGSMSRGSTE